MCQLLYSETANPPRQALVDANMMNSDGFGYAYVDEGKVHYSKGFTTKQLSDAAIDAYLDLPFPKAIHFRLATHGGRGANLTHPFPLKRGVPHDLKGSAPAVLFHNGVWHAYDDRLLDGVLAGTINPNILRGGLSDSRAMAILAQRFGEEFLGLLTLGFNKILILRADGSSQFGSWTEKEGWSASNSKIFRECEKRDGGLEKPVQKNILEKGIALDGSGLPRLTAEQLREAARAGHLNRHGNLRSKFRGGQLYDGSGREMGPSVREMDGRRERSLLDQTDKPSKGSVYLSATAEQLRMVEDAWQLNLN